MPTLTIYFSRVAPLDKSNYCDQCGAGEATHGAYSTMLVYRTGDFSALICARCAGVSWDRAHPALDWEMVGTPPKVFELKVKMIV